MRVIVFALRGCQASWLGAYGNEWVGTPNLDRLAAESVVFDRHISDCPDPDATRRAWLSELAALRGAGVRTAIVRANYPDTDAPPPYYAAWDEVFDARPQAEDESPLDALIRSFPTLLDELATVPRWLVWVETDRLLPPWDVPQDVFEAYVSDEDEPGALDQFEGRVPPFADPPTGPFDRADRGAWDWLHCTFAAVATKLDAELGWIFDELRTRGLDQTAAWIVTSDLGYPLGEHGQIGRHRPWLHEELVHVPLVIRLPGAAECGRRVPAFTQPPDLASTLCGLFGVAPTADSVGFNLLPLIRGEVDAVRTSAITRLEINGAEEWAIRTAEWAYLLPMRANAGDPPRAPLLFQKPDDRWEVSDVLSQHAERAAELERDLRATRPVDSSFAE